MPRDMGMNIRRRRRTGTLLAGITLPIIVPAFVLGISLFSLPAIIASDVRSEQDALNASGPFPISVNPSTKTIVENPSAEALLQTDHMSRLTAAAWSAKTVFVWVANIIASLPFYSNLAGSDVQFVVIKPGYRQEEVAQAFGKTLGWSAAERTKFLKDVSTTAPTLTEGEFVPGTYEVHSAMTAKDVLVDRSAKQQLVTLYTNIIK